MTYLIIEGYRWYLITAAMRKPGPMKPGWTADDAMTFYRMYAELRCRTQGE